MAEEEERRCVRCQRVAGENEAYCIQCGAPLVNHCSDSPGLISSGCGKKNDPTAAYCAHCGEATLFQQMGLVPDYSIGEPISIDSSPNKKFF